MARRQLKPQWGTPGIAACQAAAVPGPEGLAAGADATKICKGKLREVAEALLH